MAKFIKVEEFIWKHGVSSSHVYVFHNNHKEFFKKVDRDLFINEKRLEHIQDERYRYINVCRDNLVEIREFMMMKDLFSRLISNKGGSGASWSTFLHTRLYSSALLDKSILSIRMSKQVEDFYNESLEILKERKENESRTTS